MAFDNHATISILNDLIETCKDGVNGFRTAAAATKDPKAKALFTSRAPVIEHASAELQAASSCAVGSALRERYSE